MTDASPSPAPDELEVVLSPEWLNTALSTRFPGIEITSTTVTETLQTMATKVRFDVEYANAPPDAPGAFCIKGYFGVGEGYRKTAGLGETRFYRELASTLSVRVPPCHYTGIDPDTGHALIIMEDLVASGNHFLTALSPYSVDQTAATLDQLAQLHARYWGDESLASYDFLRPRLTGITSYITEDVLQEHLDGPRANTCPTRSAARRVSTPACCRAVQLAADDVSCLVHGDAHAGNLFETADGQPGLVDWQVIQRTSWALDVAYHVGAVLEVDVASAPNAISSRTTSSASRRTASTRRAGTTRGSATGATSCTASTCGRSPGWSIRPSSRSSAPAWGTRSTSTTASGCSNAGDDAGSVSSEAHLELRRLARLLEGPRPRRARTNAGRVARAPGW